MPKKVSVPLPLTPNPSPGQHRPLRQGQPRDSFTAPPRNTGRARGHSLTSSFTKRASFFSSIPYWKVLKKPAFGFPAPKSDSTQLPEICFPASKSRCG